MDKNSTAGLLRTGDAFKDLQGNVWTVYATDNSGPVSIVLDCEGPGGVERSFEYPNRTRVELV